MYSLDNPASIIPALGMLGGSASGAGKDVSGFQKKLGDGEKKVEGNFSAAEEEEAASRDLVRYIMYLLFKINRYIGRQVGR